jgi:hypothetical protein
MVDTYYPFYREKMAFFTSLKTNYPVLTKEDFTTEDEEDLTPDNSIVSVGDMNVVDSSADTKDHPQTMGQNESDRRFSYEVDPDIGVIV